VTRADRDATLGSVAESPSVSVERRELLLYAGAVAVGGVLVAISALAQPYDQNEWVQMEPYRSTDPSVITSGTRQPPLDPMLGAFVQHLLGEGQLRQRLVPMTAGIVSIALVAALLRRMRVGSVGIVAAYLLATMPILVRYAAYSRPYALPLALMLCCAWAGSRWLEGGKRRWLVVAAAAAVLAPAARVPEPVTFLGAGTVVLLWLGRRRPHQRRRSWALAATLGGALLTVGAVMVLSLQQKTGGGPFDLSPASMLAGVDDAAIEVVTFVLPLFAEWFPWWPVALVAIGVAAILPRARRLLETWYWLPLLTAPLVFGVAFHLVTGGARDYRARFAYFFGPPLIILLAAVAAALTAAWVARSPHASRWRARAGAIVLGVLLVAQLPTTLRVLTENEAPDFGQAADVVTEEVPSDAVVLFDSPTRGDWRIPFVAGRRYLTKDAPEIVTVGRLANGGEAISSPGAVHVLVLDPKCATSVVCETRPPVPWDGDLPGYEVARRFDHFTLYRPTEDQRGVSGAITALSQLTDSYGARFAGEDVAANARLLLQQGERDEARQLVLDQCQTLGDDPTGCVKTLWRKATH
jgi:hypothetical protein